MGEELTFNYNVDRYGYVVTTRSPVLLIAWLMDALFDIRHVAQPCYCGEANCVGFIGGKTQTDIGGMDDLYIDGTSSLRFSLVWISGEDEDNTDCARLNSDSPWNH